MQQHPLLENTIVTESRAGESVVSCIVALFAAVSFIIVVVVSARSADKRVTSADSVTHGVVIALWEAVRRPQRLHAIWNDEKPSLRRDTRYHSLSSVAINDFRPVSYSPDAYSLCNAVIRAKVLLAGNYRRAACQEELILERKASVMDRNAKEAKQIEQRSR